MPAFSNTLRAAQAVRRLPAPRILRDAAEHVRSTHPMPPKTLASRAKPLSVSRMHNASALAAHRIYRSAVAQPSAASAADALSGPGISQSRREASRRTCGGTNGASRTSHVCSARSAPGGDALHDTAQKERAMPTQRRDPKRRRQAAALRRACIWHTFLHVAHTPPC